MSNKVYLEEDGIIHFSVEGDQTYEKVTKSARDLEHAIKAQKSNGNPALVLLDFRKLGKHDSGARKAGFEGLRSLGYDKFAGFGASHFIKYVFNFVFTASGKGGRVQYFDTQEEAIGWLKT